MRTAKAPVIPPGAFRAAVLKWYGRHKRDLPWRRTSDPYAIWVSEIMLQQTTVNAVIPYYEKWLRLFPDPAALARTPLRRVLRTWQGLGYYARARNMRRTAKEIVARFGGAFPADYENLRKLPGFGPYTAAAIMSLAFGRPFPVVEANVRRIMMRLWGIGGEAAARVDQALLRTLETLISRRSPGRFNQALMELGALVCRPRNPSCLVCPVQSGCAALRRGEQEIIPAPRKRPTKEIEAVVAVIRSGDKVLIQKRPSTGLLADLWEFPGGKREPGESLLAALKREILEELGVEIPRARPLLTVRHAYTQYRVILHAYECRIAAEDAVRISRSTDRGSRRWVSIRALRNYPFPSGSAKIVRCLEGRLRSYRS
jgi:A/G-specific adenine glycosylase